MTRARSISRQAALLGISRSSVYYTPVVDEDDLVLRRLIDEQYTQTPFYGSRKMAAHLRRQGAPVNPAIDADDGPGGHLSEAPSQRTRSGASDLPVSAARTQHHASGSGVGGRYDVHPAAPRLALSGGHHGLVQSVCARLGDVALETGFCLAALEKACVASTPGIFNTDQGTQFTSAAFTDLLNGKRIAISMDGRGRCMDNIFTERLWRSLKYEEIYLREYHGVVDGRQGIDRYFTFYNHERPHQALNYLTPEEVYFQRAG